MRLKHQPMRYVIVSDMGPVGFMGRDSMHTESDMAFKTRDDAQKAIERDGINGKVLPAFRCCCNIDGKRCTRLVFANDGMHAKKRLPLRSTLSEPKEMFFIIHKICSRSFGRWGVLNALLAESMAELQSTLNRSIALQERINCIHGEMKYLEIQELYS